MSVSVLQSFASRLAAAQIVPVLTLDHADQAEPLANVLMEAGLGAVELALRTPAAFAALRALRRAGQDLMIGAGTVLNPDQADAAQTAGADFALAPGLDAATVRHSQSIGLPFIPGVATATEIQAAAALGCSLLKWFPAEPLGGVRGLRALAAPFRHLGLRYLPLGGITAETAATYLAEPDIIAIGGSWIATPELIRQQAWDEIGRNARHAAALMAGTRKFFV